MQCPQCGNDNGASNAFSEACGAPLGPTCGACGHNNRPGSRSRGNCRHPLTAESPAPARVGVHTGEGVVQAVQAEWDLAGNRSFAQEELRLARELMEETGVALFGRLPRDRDDKLARGIRFEPVAAGADAAVSHLGRTG